jgi:hypothetical protein
MLEKRRRYRSISSGWIQRSPGQSRRTKFEGGKIHWLLAIKINPLAAMFKGIGKLNTIACQTSLKQLETFIFNTVPFAGFLEISNAFWHYSEEQNAG